MASSDTRVNHDLVPCIAIFESFADSLGCSKRQDRSVEAVGKLDESIETSLSVMA